MIARPDRQDPRLETHRAWPSTALTWCQRPTRYGGTVDPTYTLSLRGPGEEPSCLGCPYHWMKLNLIFG